MIPAGRGRRALPESAIATALLTALCCSGAARPPAPAGPPLRMVMPALDGGQIDLTRYRGRVVVLHAFTTWSLASQVDVEQLIAVHEANRERVVVIGIALDPDGYRLVSPWRRAMRVSYLIALAPERVRSGDSPLGRIAEVPTTLVLSRDGAVVERVNGPLARGQLHEILADLVPEE